MGEGGEGKKKLKKKKVDVVFSDTRPSCCAREGVPGGQCHLYTLPLTCFGFLSICDFRLGKKFRKKRRAKLFHRDESLVAWSVTGASSTVG